MASCIICIFKDVKCNIMYASQLQMTPLLRASSEGHTTTVQLLLEANADVNTRNIVSTSLVLYVCESRDGVKEIIYVIGCELIYLEVTGLCIYLYVLYDYKNCTGKVQQTC